MLYLEIEIIENVRSLTSFMIADVFFTISFAYPHYTNTVVRNRNH
jgi:hypothetical protein